MNQTTLSKNIQAFSLKKRKAGLFVATAIVFLFFSCSNENYTPTAKHTINVDLTQNKRILFSEIFDSVRYVKLETTDDILIERIRILKYSNNRIYIMDGGSGAIFAFDANTGESLWKIQNMGQGPGEYLRPIDFDIDEENERLYLFCRAEKIQEYDLSGNFIQEHNVSINGYSVAWDRDKMYIYGGNNPQWLAEQWKNDRLFIYDPENNRLIGKLPFEDHPLLGGVHTYQSGYKAFYSYKGTTYFFSPYSYDIYFLKGDEVKPFYRFDFGESNFPENKNMTYYSREELKGTNYAEGLHLCWENDQYLNVNTATYKDFYHVMYSKKEKTVRVGAFYNDMDYRTIDFLQATDDWALGQLSATDCFEENDYTKKHYEGKTSSLINKLRTEITEDDNPVLFFYYFKK